MAKILALLFQSWRTASWNSESIIWHFWLCSDTLLYFPYFELTSWLAWESGVLFPMHMFFKNSFNSSQHFRLLCVIAIHSSPLTNLYNGFTFLGSVTLNAICTFAMNASTVLLSPLIVWKASLTCCHLLLQSLGWLEVLHKMSKQALTSEIFLVCYIDHILFQDDFPGCSGLLQLLYPTVDE